MGCVATSFTERIKLNPISASISVNNSMDYNTLWTNESVDKQDLCQTNLENKINLINQIRAPQTRSRGF